MVMQAEHIPVHLGAMPAAVARSSARTTRPGRSWILNDPYRGGTHLPDITVITPVFAGGSSLVAFAASRAHHADVGGPTPGSMPADSRTLSDEGVVIEPRLLDEAAIAEISGQMRRPDQRRADLRAQLAAGRVGALPARPAGRAGGGRRAAGGVQPRCSTTPSAAPAPACTRWTTASASPRTCWRHARATCGSRCVRPSGATG